jgi:hypothetical protein
MDYYVIYRSRNVATGVHTYRDGPCGQQQAVEKANRIALRPNVIQVFITWDTPYFKEGQYHKVK